MDRRSGNLQAARGRGLRRAGAWGVAVISAVLRAEDGRLSESKSHPRAWGTFTRILGKYVRDEKLLPLEIPGAAPPTLVTAEPEVVAAFAREYEEVVVKPVHEFSGRGITRLSTVTTDGGDQRSWPERYRVPEATAAGSAPAAAANEVQTPTVQEEAPAHEEFDDASVEDIKDEEEII